MNSLSANGNTASVAGFGWIPRGFRGILAEGPAPHGQEDFGKHLYSHADDEAVRHIFRVTSSLDSMVVGEPQVLGQVRHAYSLAVEAGTAGRVLNRLVHQAFRVAKRASLPTMSSSGVCIRTSTPKPATSITALVNPTLTTCPRICLIISI